MRFFSFLALISVFSCKPRSADSSAQSLSNKELKDCGIYNGKRFLFALTPEIDFASDWDVLRASLVKNFGSKDLAGLSYLKTMNGELSDACKLYVETEQAKYELDSHLHGDKATKENIEKAIEALGKRIVQVRKEIAFKDPELAKTFEVQLVLAVSSHGEGLDEFNPDGGIILAAPKISSALSAGARSSGKIRVSPQSVDMLLYKDFLALLRKHILTPCPDEKCVVDPKSRRADEVVIYMDNCFSGKLMPALEAGLEDMPGYKPRQGFATRVLAFSSASGTQVSPGSYVGSGHGTLFKLLNDAVEYYSANKDGNNVTTYQEFASYVTEGSEAALMRDLTDGLQQNVASMLCNKEIRNAFVASLALDESTRKDFLADPINASRGKTTFGMVLLKPEFFTNVAKKEFEELIFTAPGPMSSSQTALQKSRIEANKTSLAKDNKKMTLLKEIVSKIFDNAKDLNKGEVADINILKLSADADKVARGYVTEQSCSMFKMKGGDDQAPGPKPQSDGTSIEI